MSEVNQTDHQSPRRKQMGLTIVAAVAATIVTGCSSRTQQCVDAAGRPIPNSACRAGGGAGYSYPHYIYRRSGGSSFFGGSHGTSSGTVRGGFGFHGFGGG